MSRRHGNPWRHGRLVPANVRAGLGAALLLGALAACGIPTDGAPRIPDIPTTTDSVATTTTPAGNELAYIYFARDNEIVVTERELESTSPAEVVNAVAAGPTPSEELAGMISQLPPGVEVLSADSARGVLRLDLSEEFDNITGRAKAEAAAQIVFSVTEQSDIEEVVFFVDGDLTFVTSPVLGDTNRVSACDFVSYLAPDDTLREFGTKEDAVTHVATRRTLLEERCPPVDP